MAATVRPGRCGTTCLDDVAAILELAIVRWFADGTSGAALVTDASGGELVLKALPQPDPEPVWKVGASMARRLRDSGYPSAPLRRGRSHIEHLPGQRSTA